MHRQSRRRFLSSLAGGAAGLASGNLVAVASNDPIDVFRIDGFAEPGESELHSRCQSLIQLLGRHGVFLYRSHSLSATASPEGIIGPDDVVMIKVNAQWDKRGMTNVDLVQAVIEGIFSHPDGFQGEVVLVENSQFRRSDFPQPNGNSFNWQQITNAEDRTRTFEQVAAELAGQGRVSCFDWTNLEAISTWPENDHTTNAYHKPNQDLAVAACYPRFTTQYGTRVNFRDGIWTGEGYDRNRLKLINIPVLKDHSIYNATACVKHYMGVVINYYHNTFVRDCGIMMTTTRVPDLNILDCTYVGVSGGPGVGDAGATRQDILIAGLDPVSVDYYAAKHVLHPLTNKTTHNPDPSAGGTNQLQRYLENARAALQEAGFRTMSGLSDAAVRPVTLDTAVHSWPIHGE
ncbi:MAG: DUF362 domain-containing protein [bacterium]